MLNFHTPGEDGLQLWGKAQGLQKGPAMLPGLVFCSLRNVVGSIVSLVCCMDVTEVMLPELIMCLILWVTFTVFHCFDALFFFYKCSLKIACRSHVRIEMGGVGYVYFFLLTKVGEKGQKNGFPSCLKAGCVWDCHQVKLSALERTKSAGACSRVPSLGTTPSALLHRR